MDCTHIYVGGESVREDLVVCRRGEYDGGKEGKRRRRRKRLRRRLIAPNNKTHPRGRARAYDAATGVFDEITLHRFRPVDVVAIIAHHRRSPSHAAVHFIRNALGNPPPPPPPRTLLRRRGLLRSIYTILSPFRQSAGTYTRRLWEYMRSWDMYGQRPC